MVKAFNKKEIKKTKKDKIVGETLQEELQEEVFAELEFETPEEDLISNRRRGKKDQHKHNGTDSEQISLIDLIDFIETVTEAPTHTPRFFYEQFKIFSGTLYFYDAVLEAWVTAGASTKATIRAKTTQSINDITVTTIVWSTEDFDVGGDFASNTFTAPRTGYYAITCAVNISIVAAGDQVQLYIKKGGATLLQVPFYASAAGFQQFMVTDILSLTADDEITIQIFHDCGSTRSLADETKLTINEL